MTFSLLKTKWLVHTTRIHANIISEEITSKVALVKVKTVPEIKQPFDVEVKIN